ncbi:Crp/Fnr family transcriptional regulator [Fodinicola acaciae]|uniref:Crp/Fnr family transcriptional regulator n=1 Tax=Fodinicola acaciae TaxID=2681555 RepID=UPI0013D7C465|nr:cyclic nucleotide-binding domain-containing protein [Fodinicola acaciae]
MVDIFTDVDLIEDVTFAAGERIFAEGEPATTCWMIRDGLVALDTVAPGRGTLVVQTLGPGDLLGWSWLVPPYRWHFGAVATIETRASAVDAARLRDISDADPEFGYAMAKKLLAALLDRLQHTRARLLDLYAVPHDR